MRISFFSSCSKRNWVVCLKMAAAKHQKWIFSKQILLESPSRKAGIDMEKELSYRQQAANLIQDMGQRLSVNQLTINTAIVYMHRFYVYRSFTVFSRYAIAPTALFLAAKVEEQPKKLQHVLQICHACLHPDKPSLDPHGDAYMKQAQELVQNELVLLQTLGFEISVDHPHTHVVKCTQLVKASRDLSQMAYFMATNSLHLTTFCLLYKPTVVAAMCIHLSCKWSKYEIPLSSDGKPYWSYMDPSVTESLLDTIITEFLKILNRCPTRLRKLKNYQPSQNNKDGQDQKEESKPQYSQSSSSSQGSTSQTSSHQQPPVKKPSNQPPPPPKEKKQTLSFEEYKKAHAAKTMAKVPPPPPAPRVDEQVKKPSNDKSRDHDTPQPSKNFKQLDRKQVIELYHKNPEKLRQYLKYKAQFVPLNNEEKGLYGKVQAKEEERRKRKAAAEMAAKNNQNKPVDSAAQASCVESPSGQLTLRIKLGAKADPAKSSSVAKITASNSESHSSPRKRSHEDTGGLPSSKHAKRSEKHKNHLHSGGSSSRSDSKRRLHHKHSNFSGSEKPAPGIDEAVFQKSLSDAMSKVKQQQTGIPTMTLKRANNGKESNYFMSVSNKRGEFDPTAPVSTEVPDDIFEEDQHGFARGVDAPADSLLSGDTSADASTPESGEIRKESPVYEKPSKQNRGQKVTSLFSPDATADSQLMRSSSGYHSSQDNDYQPPVLLPNHYVQ